MGENKFSVIFDLLKADILAGKFADGRPLPSAPALMRRFGVARATAVAALKELVRCGFATSRRGKGTFPSERTSTRTSPSLPSGRLGSSSPALRIPSSFFLS